ncbi:MAG: EVE domain-containing protein [Cetobacterium somerae]|uniref:EVE domain-containing protein n=1 Tax=Cetobacterium somerae TaxID=188913 RepID=UPI003F2E4DD3
MENINYYIIVTTPDDFKYDIQMSLAIIGLPDRNANRLSNLKKGDKVIYYLIGLKCFAAISEVDGDYFYDDKNQLWGDAFELFPARRKMKKILLCTNINKALYINPLVEKLTFIQKKHKWGVYFQGSFRSIPKEDFLFLENLLSKNLKS